MVFGSQMCREGVMGKESLQLRACQGAEAVGGGGVFPVSVPSGSVT